MSQLCMIEGVWENVRLGPFIHMKGWGFIGGTSRQCMICQNQRGNYGWFVVCMGDEMDDRLVVLHNETNGQWGLQSFMKRDKLGDMGHLVPMW